MEKMKVYVYVKDVRTDDYDETEVTVYGKKEDALAALKKDRDDVIGYWGDGSDWKIIELDNDDSFYAYEDGYCMYNHDDFHVVEREVN